MSNFVDNIKKINKKYIILALIMILLVSSFIVYKFVFTQKVQYTITNGFIEKISENQGLLILNEQIIDIKENSSIIPIIEEGKRASKNEVIATYKNSEYDEYVKKIEKMDLEIETLVNDLPSTYSADISSIDREISKLSTESLKITSYVKMQEYKKKINELSKKKIMLLSDLSPEGSKIRELTELRNKYEQESKSFGNNIKSSTGGIVSYKVDGLERNLNNVDIDNFNSEYINNLFSEYSSNNSTNFGIKIVDNYNSYLIVKEARGENDQYIKVDKKYTLRIIDNNYQEISAKLISHSQDEEYNYVVFEICNNIEDIYYSRFVGVEIVWKRIEGLAVPINALKLNEEKNYYYLDALKYGDYTEIPVSLQLLSDSIAIIDNISDEEKESLGLKDSYNIKLYDRIIIE